MSWFRRDGSDLILQVRVQPRASRDAIAGVMGDCLKIRLTAPPVEGKANNHLIAYLAELFGVPKNHVILERGDSSKQKRLRIRTPKKLPKNLDWGT
ncbi:MAG: YggU family protein [Gammaproteobacteria bacterium]|nr:YggU family protein [Gammaproteobacteria bacterium]